jgi:methionyl-tRNA formyltransferase
MPWACNRRILYNPPPLPIKMSNEGLSLRIALVGSVSSSAITLCSLLKNGANVVGVLGLRPENSANVSGYVDLKAIAGSNNIEYLAFEKINTSEIADHIEKWNLDILFVVGLSQLVGDRILKMPRLGCIGFHPTWLPQGRGRAPIAWLTKYSLPGAATFFLMDEGADSGPIIFQEPFFVAQDSYASEVTKNMEAAIGAALDRWIPQLLRGEWNPLAQDSAKATFFGRRSSEDGLINWLATAKEIHALVRASSYPHPGAYTFYKGERLRIWRTQVEGNTRWHGVPGRLLDGGKDGGWLVQSGDEPIRILEWDLNGISQNELRGGVKLGFTVEEELFSLREKVRELTTQLAFLQKPNG